MKPNHGAGRKAKDFSWITESCMRIQKNKHDLNRFTNRLWKKQDRN